MKNLLTHCVKEKKINKKVKKVILFIGLMITLLFSLIWIGIIHTPKAYILWHFNKNKQSFQNIVRYSKANMLEIHRSEYISNPNEYGEISSDLFKVFIQGNYSNIWGTEAISFSTSSIFVPYNGVYAVVYTEGSREDEEIYDSHDNLTEYIAYEPLGGNWYLKYRKPPIFTISTDCSTGGIIEESKLYSKDVN